MNDNSASNVISLPCKPCKIRRSLQSLFKIKNKARYISKIHAYNPIRPGVTGQNIPPAGVYPGLKRPRLDYTRVYYGLGQLIPRGILWPIGQFIPPQAKLYFHDINHNLNSVERYTQELFNFQQVIEYSVLSAKLSEKTKLTELKS